MIAGAFFLLAIAAAVISVAKGVEIIARAGDCLDVDFDTAADEAVELSWSGLDELQVRRLLNQGRG